MPLNFLQRHGAQRMRDYQAQPMMLSAPDLPGLDDDDEDEHDAAREPRLPNVRLDYESTPAAWQARRVTCCDERGSVTVADLDAWKLRPLFFVDGKDAGRCAAWLRTQEGYPVPLRVSQIGAVTMRNDNGQLRRDGVSMDRVATFVTDYFAPEEVDEFREQADAAGFRLLGVPLPDEKFRFDFEVVSGRTRRRSRFEMNRLESEMVRRIEHRPAMVDGRLDQHDGAYDPALTPVLGVVKSHHQLYLQAESHCCTVLYNLEPGSRTPAFLLPDKKIVTWYVRLCGSNGELPNWGAVRLELPQPFFEDTLSRDFGCVDAYSRLVCEYRCRDDGYGRAPVSLHPIVRAEQSLGALFQPVETLVQQFYHRFGL